MNSVAAREESRINDLRNLIPQDIETAIDIGARDGRLTKHIVKGCNKVVALDLEQPKIELENLICVKGDARNLEYPDNSFDLVICSEVLEHIPTNDLRTVCNELSRVSSKYILVGVPFKQDIRISRTTCNQCGGINPPYGHVNSFDEKKIEELFPSCTRYKTSFVGQNKETTNRISVALMDMAGNPYGTYNQEEVCIHCGMEIGSPKDRGLVQKLITKVASVANKAQSNFTKPHANWIHILLKKQQ